MGRSLAHIDTLRRAKTPLDLPGCIEQVHNQCLSGLSPLLKEEAIVQTAPCEQDPRLNAGMEKRVDCRIEPGVSVG